LGAHFKIISFIGQLLSLTLLACTVVVLLGDNLQFDYEPSWIKYSFTVGIICYFLINCLYILTFSHLQIDGYLSTMKTLHLILLFFVVNPFVSGYYFTFSISLHEIFCLVPVSFTIDLIYLYLLYKKFSNRFVNSFHVLPKIILYTLLIYDQISHLYALINICFPLLFVIDYLFYVKLYSYNVRAEKKLDFMDLEEYSNTPA
jgi:hypothetical protein